MKQALKTSQKASQRALFLRERLCFTPKKGKKPSKTPPAVDYRGIFRQKKYAVKEPDPETGLYYYGSRYLDPKTSRWLSGDPALGEYLPSAPLGDEEKKRNSNLPGQGGVFNYVNLHVYHYAGNNPVKYVDPDGEYLISTASASEYARKNPDVLYQWKNIPAILANVNGNLAPINIWNASPYFRLTFKKDIDNALRNIRPDNIFTKTLVTAHANHIGDGIYEIEVQVNRIFTDPFDGSSEILQTKGIIAYATHDEVGANNKGGTADSTKVKQIADQVLKTANINVEIQN